jgi:hypothetical protein
VENIRFSGKRENSIFVLKILHQHKESKSLCTFFFWCQRDLIPFNLLHKPCPTKTNLEKQGPKYTKTNQTSKVYLISCTCCILPSKWNQPWETFSRSQGRSHQGPSPKSNWVLVSQGWFLKSTWQNNQANGFP